VIRSLAVSALVMTSMVHLQADLKSSRGAGAEPTRSTFCWNKQQKVERVFPLDSDEHASRPRRKPRHAAVVSSEGAAGTVVESLPTLLPRRELGRLWSPERHYLPGCAAGSSVGELLQGTPRRVCGAAGSLSLEPRPGGVAPSAEVGLRERFMSTQIERERVFGSRRPAVPPPAGPGRHRIRHPHPVQEARAADGRRRRSGPRTERN